MWFLQQKVVKGQSRVDFWLIIWLRHDENSAEHNSMIEIHIVDETGIKYLEAYGDFKLIVIQVQGEYEVRHGDLMP